MSSSQSNVRVLFHAKSDDEAGKSVVVSLLNVTQKVTAARQHRCRRWWASAAMRLRLGVGNTPFCLVMTVQNTKATMRDHRATLWLSGNIVVIVRGHQSRYVIPSKISPGITSLMSAGERNGICPSVVQLICRHLLVTDTKSPQNSNSCGSCRGHAPIFNYWLK